MGIELTETEEFRPVSLNEYLFGTPVQQQSDSFVELAYRKSMWLVGGYGCGKTVLSQTVARMECVRQDLSTFYCGKGLDALGLLTKAGEMPRFAAFVISDFTLTFGMGIELDSESIKGLLGVDEVCEHRARYYPAKWPAERMRIFSVNAGKPGEANPMGWWFRYNSMNAISCMIAGDREGFDACSDDSKAMCRRVVVFPLLSRNIIGIDVAKAQQGAAQRAGVRRNRLRDFVSSNISKV
jgi:hypothetical protein